MTDNFFNSSISSGNSLEKPSIFVLIAADGLKNTLQPALNYLIRILCNAYPEKLGSIYKFSDEIYLFLDLLLEHHYLRYHKALFSENFYGIQRHWPEYKSIITRVLLLNVILPYIKLKLDTLFEDLLAQSDIDFETNQEEKSTEKLLKKSKIYFKLIYPYIHLVYQSLNLWNNFLYAIGKSDFHSLWTKLAGTKLKFYNSSNKLSKDTQYESLGSLLMSKLAISITLGLEAGSFFLQFIDWWYSYDNSKSVSLTSLPIPIPPILNENNEKASRVKKCPICRGPRKNETLIPSSGYVFCYICLVQHLRNNGKYCPITQYPTDENQLIRIYTEI